MVVATGREQGGPPTRAGPGHVGPSITAPVIPLSKFGVEVVVAGALGVSLLPGVAPGATGPQAASIATAMNALARRKIGAITVALRGVSHESSRSSLSTTEGSRWPCPRASGGGPSWRSLSRGPVAKWRRPATPESRSRGTGAAKDEHALASPRHSRQGEGQRRLATGQRSDAALRKKTRADRADCQAIWPMSTKTPRGTRREERGASS